MSNQKNEIDLSLQSTLLLIAKMLREGHDGVGAGLSPMYLEQAAQTIDALTDKCAQLEAQLSRYLPDREMYE